MSTGDNSSTASSMSSSMSPSMSATMSTANIVTAMSSIAMSAGSTMMSTGSAIMSTVAAGAMSTLMNTSGSLMMNATATMSTTVEPQEVATYAAQMGEVNATWILLTTFSIFTMQTGFAFLEIGCGSVKNGTNIALMCVADVVVGGLAYWFFGYAFGFGDWPQGNSFIGVGDFALYDDDYNTMGNKFVRFVFMMSFATASTTIVSGAAAERMRYRAYLVFAFFNMFTYSVVTHWIWDTGKGWLALRGVVDIAGSGVVHLCGGTSALVVAALLGPRTGRWDNGYTGPAPSNPKYLVLGTFVLWWGWLAFNSGSTFGVSNNLWQLAARAATNTLLAPIGGGIVGLFYGLIMSKGETYSVSDICNGILGGLVAVTAPCAVVRSWEGLIIGLIAGLVTCGSLRLVDRMHVDDPVGAVGVHFCSGIWGMASVGLFVDAEPSNNLNNGLLGLFHHGLWYPLGIQLAAVCCIIAWSGALTIIIVGFMRLTWGIRVTEQEEEVGLDLVEHDLRSDEYSLTEVKPRRRSIFFKIYYVLRHRRMYVDKPMKGREDVKSGEVNGAYHLDVVNKA